nr:MAG: ORF1 [Giant panda anellovirus]
MARYLHWRRRWPRRRYYRRRRGPFRFGLRRRAYFRRRRPVRRRRFFKKRTYKSAIIQWHPSHRSICYITGWGIGLYGVGTNTTCNFQTYVPPTHLAKGYYRQLGGGASLYHLSLEWLYQEHQKRRNVWSHTNEGFDLARYFGTKFTLWPHPDLDYIFWYETDFGGLRKEHYMLLHPAQAMLEKRHVIVKSIKNGGKKPKKIRVPPPSVHQSQWYFMNQWCDVALARFGFSLINLKTPFIHSDLTKPWVTCGVSTGVKTKDKAPTDKTSPTAPKVFYKFRWDNGIDNQIAVCQWKPDTQKLIFVSITKVDVPYWLYWFGWGWQNFYSGEYWYYYIWWYNDRVDKSPEVFEPEDLPDKQKEWILMRYDNVEIPTCCINLVQRGPFVMSRSDLPNKVDIYNLYFKYQSKWQWGGTSPTIESTIDPCNQPPTSYQRDNVRIGDPSTTGSFMLHPWDVDKDGLITKHKLRQLIGDVPSTSTGGQKEVPQKLPQVDSAPSTEEDTQESSSSEDWNSEEEENQNTYRLLMHRIFRERKHRKKLRRRIKRLVNS